MNWVVSLAWHTIFPTCVRIDETKTFHFSDILLLDGSTTHWLEFVLDKWFLDKVICQTDRYMSHNYISPNISEKAENKTSRKKNLEKDVL